MMTQSKESNSSSASISQTVKKARLSGTPTRFRLSAEAAKGVLQLMGLLSIENGVSKPKAAGEELNLSGREEILNKLRRMGSQLGSDHEKKAFLDRTMERFEHEFLAVSYGLRQEILSDLANMDGERGITWFWRKWSVAVWQENPNELVGVRDELRSIWRRDTELSQDLVWGPGLEHSEHTLNNLLRWRPSPEQEEARKSEHRQVVMEGIRSGVWWARYTKSMPDEQLVFDMPFTCSLYSRRLVPHQNNLRAMLIQGVFEHWGHFKYCANPDC